MMAGEKPGGHGERCVAVGALDMAIWDAAAKIADEPLCRHIARRRAACAAGPRAGVRGRRLSLSARRRGPAGGRGAACVALGFNRIKIKIGGADLDADRRRIETVLARLPTDGRLAVDAMNAYGPASARAAARMLSGYGLWWFEDICDPLDFETLADVAASYPSPIAAGEALFSLPEAPAGAAWRPASGSRRAGVRSRALLRPHGLCSNRRGIPGARLARAGVLAAWRAPVRPARGGGTGLGGAELNPFAFQPFCGQAEGGRIVDGMADLPQAPGIGFEAHAGVALLRRVFPDLRLGS